MNETESVTDSESAESDVIRNKDDVSTNAIDQSETKEPSLQSRAPEPKDEYHEVVGTMLRILRYASSVGLGRGAHNKIPMKERVRYCRIALDAGSKLLEHDTLDKYQQKQVKQTKDELIKALHDGKIKVNVNLSE